jgi:hypothetical protein
VIYTLTSSAAVCPNGNLSRWKTIPPSPRPQFWIYSPLNTRTGSRRQETLTSLGKPPEKKPLEGLFALAPPPGTSSPRVRRRWGSDWVGCHRSRSQASQSQFHPAFPNRNRSVRTQISFGNGASIPAHACSVATRRGRSEGRSRGRDGRITAVTFRQPGWKNQQQDWVANDNELSKLRARRRLATQVRPSTSLHR